MLPKKTEQMEKICGNCRYHNAYNYPDQVFCFAKFADPKKNPAVSIFSTCEDWENKVQDCFCLEDARRKQVKKSK